MTKMYVREKVCMRQGGYKSFTLGQGGGGLSQKFHPYLGVKKYLGIMPPPPPYINNEHSLKATIKTYKHYNMNSICIDNLTM